MSRNIAIKEGDNPKTFNNVKKIIIKNTDGSNGYWIPDALGTKHINENGTYKASEEKDEHDVNKGWVGYSEVTVSGIGSTDFTAGAGDHLNGEDLEDGEDYTHNKDGSVSRQPKTLRFEELPTKMTYEDGETIDLEGAVVRAYSKKGKPWEGDDTHPNGVIPLEELTLDPEKADKSKSTGIGEKELDGVSIEYLPLNGVKNQKWGSTYDFDLFKTDGYMVRFKQPNNDVRNAILSESQVVNYSKHNPQNEKYTDATTTLPAITLSNGRVVYGSDNMAGTAWGYGGDWTHGGAWHPETTGSVPPPTNEKQGGFTFQEVADILFLGRTIKSGGQEITVKWRNPSNYKEISTTLGINVVESNDAESDDFEGGGGHDF